MKKPKQMSQKLKEWVLRGLALEKNKGLGQRAVARMLKKQAEASCESSGGVPDETFLHRISRGTVPQSMPIGIDRRYAIVAGWLEELGVTTRDEFFKELRREGTPSLNPSPQSNPSPQERTVVLRPGEALIARATQPNEAVIIVIRGAVEVEFA